MPIDPPQNDPLGLFIDQDQEDTAESSLSADELAFRQAIYEDYDNPEIYGDPTVPQILKLHIFQQLLPTKPTIISVELNADDLPDALVEGMFSLMSYEPELPARLARAGAQDFAQFRREFESEEPEKFAELRQGQSRFFIRHFPRLMLSLYGIGVVSSHLASVLSMWREEPDAELNNVEALARDTLEKQIKQFEKIIKEIVGTRSSGRPRKIADSSFPAVVNQVIEIAQEMMGDDTGEDAVPGLKEIAAKLEKDLSEGALGKRLKRAGFSWTVVKSYLANPDPSPSATNPD